MTKMKLFMPLLVILIMGMATSAFAQLTCGVASTPVSRAIITGHTERAGDLIFTCVAGPTATTAATVTIDFGVPITDNTAYPVAPNNVSIVSQTGGFIAGGSPVITTVSNPTGQIILTVPAQAVPANGTFNLTNVLVSLNGSGKTNLTATVSVSPGSNFLITAGQNVATVITTIGPGLGAPSLTGTAALFQGTGAQVTAATNSFQVNVPENFIDSVRTLAQAAVAINGGATNSTQILWTFSGLPTGWLISNCAATLTGTFGDGSASVPAAVGAAGAGGASVTITALATNLTAVETMSLRCGSVNGGGFGPSLVVPAGTTAIATAPITAVVTLAPTGAALSSGGAVLTTAGTGQIPRFQDSPSAALTVITFTPATTTFIIPFATASGAAAPPAGTFNTGIAIANTTADPATFGVIPNGPARDQSGTITFTMFPADGVTPSFSFTSPNVPLGGSYVANLSQILQGSTPPVTGSFTGYIIGVANFTNAHGTAFVYGGNTADSRLTSATEILVIPPPVIVPRTVLPFGPGAEATTK